MDVPLAQPLNPAARDQPRSGHTARQFRGRRRGRRVLHHQPQAPSARQRADRQPCPHLLRHGRPHPHTHMAQHHGCDAAGEHRRQRGLRRRHRPHVHARHRQPLGGVVLHRIWSARLYLVSDNQWNTGRLDGGVRGQRQQLRRLPHRCHRLCWQRGVAAAAGTHGLRHSSHRPMQQHPLVRQRLRHLRRIYQDLPRTPRRRSRHSAHTGGHSVPQHLWRHHRGGLL